MRLQPTVTPPRGRCLPVQWLRCWVSKSGSGWKSDFFPFLFVSIGINGWAPACKTEKNKKTESKQSDTKRGSEKAEIPFSFGKVA